MQDRGPVVFKELPRIINKFLWGGILFCSNVTDRIPRAAVISRGSKADGLLGPIGISWAINNSATRFVYRARGSSRPAGYPRHANKGDTNKRKQIVRSYARQ